MNRIELTLHFFPNKPNIISFSSLDKRFDGLFSGDCLLCCKFVGISLSLNFKFNI